MTRFKTANLGVVYNVGDEIGCISLVGNPDLALSPQPPPPGVTSRARGADSERNEPPDYRTCSKSEADDV